MSMKEKRCSRVLLALDTSPRSRAALELATALAAQLDAKLAGLFVEDVNLLRLGALPFTREIGPFSRISRPVELHEMEQSLRREAAAAQRLLAEAADALQLQWSFQIARGQVAAELFSLAADSDLIVLGKQARLGMRLFGAAVSNRRPPGTVAPGPVLAVFDGSPASRRALQLASRLAQTGAAELRLLVPEPEFSRCVAEAVSLLPPELAHPACRTIPPADFAALAAATRDEQASMLVLAGDGGLRGGTGFATLLNEVDCPVILLG